MMKMHKAESYDSGVEFDNQLVPISALAHEYSTDLDKKSKRGTIEDRDLGTLETSTNNMIVAVRVRPLSKKEIEREEFEIIRVMDKKLVILMDPLELMNAKGYLGMNRSKERQYAFDYAFDSNTGQKEIFENTTKFLVEGILEGYNATVFAYGATGAGKTYTMLGTEANPGNMFLTLKELFVKIKGQRNNYNYDIRVSFLEIYNEMIRDLIVVSEDVLDLREDKDKGICVAGLSEVEVESPEDVMELLFFGNQNRTQEATGANETSSRSHAILQIIVEAKDKASGTTAEIAVGKLSLIDLAGSERAAKTNNRGIRMIEGANINRSLLSLGNCINALVDNMKKGSKNHIPYRDSKLTRLLKDSLGGNSRTVMIANISPGNDSYEDTHNTLKYANRAKNIKTSIKKNVHNVEYHVSKYTQIINQLKSEVSSLKQQLEGKEHIPRSNLKSTLEMGESLVENIEVYQQELAAHFAEETQTKKRIEELEQKAELCKLSIANLRSSITQSVKENGRDHHTTLDLSKELENLYKNEKQFKAQCETKKQLMSNLKMKRDNFAKQWENAGLSQVGTKMLELQMKQHVIIIDNIDIENQTSKATMQLQARDQVLQRMQEQIRIRDNLLNLAEKHFSENNVDVQLDDPKLVSIEEIVKINSSLPPIHNNPYAIRENSYINKNTVNDRIAKVKYRSRLAGNTSLPPMNGHKEAGENGSYFSNKKYPYKGKAYLNANPYGSNSNRGKGAIVVSNGAQRSSQGNVNSFHSRMIRNKHNFSTPSIQAKQRYGFKVQTAGVRDSSDSKISPTASSKNSKIPKTGQRKAAVVRGAQQRRLRSPEERKRSDSVRSNSSIISTASSNSPGGKKGKFDPNNLQIAGQPLSVSVKLYLRL
jgi:kinesin family protein 18/19